MRNIELKMSKHIRRRCLRSVALKVEDTALIWILTSAKKQKVLVNSKCYHKEIMSPGCFIIIYLGYIPIIFMHSLVGLVLQPVITTFRVSDKSW